FVRDRGGLERTRAFTRIWLALFGLWSWDALPALPPEIMLLPAGAPLSIYRFGCWARQTIVALAIVLAARPNRPLPFDLDALRLRGYALDHPVMRAGLDGLERFVIGDGDTRRLEACQSPVWDTALAVIALTDAGIPADDPALVRAADWLLAEEVRVRGDWAVQRPGLEPGGWAFEFANDIYPDVDDT